MKSLSRNISISKQKKKPDPLTRAMIVSRTHLGSFCSTGVRALWQYGLWSFPTGGTKLERFLPQNRHTQRKLLNFENTTVIYMSSSFWLLAVGSRGLQLKLKQKQLLEKLSKQVFVSQLKINHVIHQPTAKNYIISQYMDF